MYQAKKQQNYIKRCVTISFYLLIQKILKKNKTKQRSWNLAFIAKLNLKNNNKKIIYNKK